MPTVTKKELIDRIAEATGQRRTLIRETVQTFLDTIIDELEQGNRIEFREFGVFEVREKAQRVAQNPKTQERVVVPAKRSVKFKVGRAMKNRVETPLPVEPIADPISQPEITVTATQPVAQAPTTPASL